MSVTLKVGDRVRVTARSRVKGYQDQNDHDILRTDPVFKLIAERSPTDPDLASQPTLSRFENQINITSLKRLRQVFMDQFIASFAQPPLSLTFDLDAVTDPAHGSQQLTLFHAFYEQYQYLPLVITAAETGQVVMVSLRHGTAAASLGADNDLEYLVRLLNRCADRSSRGAGQSRTPYSGSGGRSRTSTHHWWLGLSDPPLVRLRRGASRPSYWCHALTRTPLGRVPVLTLRRASAGLPSFPSQQPYCGGYHVASQAQKPYRYAPRPDVHSQPQKPRHHVATDGRLSRLLTHPPPSCWRRRSRPP